MGHSFQPLPAPTGEGRVGAMLRPYQDGYRKGYLEAQLEALGVSADIGLAEADALDASASAGKGLSAEAEGDFWLGFYHGRSHGRTGEAPWGARQTAN